MKRPVAPIESFTRFQLAAIIDFPVPVSKSKWNIKSAASNKQFVARWPLWGPANSMLYIMFMVCFRDGRSSMVHHILCPVWFSSKKNIHRAPKIFPNEKTHRFVLNSWNPTAHKKQNDSLENPIAHKNQVTDAKSLRKPKLERFILIHFSSMFMAMIMSWIWKISTRSKTKIQSFDEGLHTHNFFMFFLVFLGIVGCYFSGFLWADPMKPHYNAHPPWWCLMTLNK